MSDKNEEKTPCKDIKLTKKAKKRKNLQIFNERPT